MQATIKSNELRSKLLDFAIKTIKLTKSLPRSPESTIITNQIIKSSTSIGANYSEAMFALTKPEFIHCINICKKETGETLHWLEILSRIYPNLTDNISQLHNECESFLKIFIATVRTAQKNNK